jgi:hypothetical protein
MEPLSTDRKHKLNARGNFMGFETRGHSRAPASAT